MGKPPAWPPPRDTTLTRLIEDLRVHQPHFHALWERGEVDAYQHEVKAFTHPDIGRFTLDCDILPLDGQQDYQARPSSTPPPHRAARRPNCADCSSVAVTTPP